MGNHSLFTTILTVQVIHISTKKNVVQYFLGDVLDTSQIHKTNAKNEIIAYSYYPLVLE